MKHLKTFENNNEDIAFSVGDIIKNIDGYLNYKLFKVIKIYIKQNKSNISISHVLNSELNSELTSYDYFVEFIDINNEVYTGTFAKRFRKATQEEIDKFNFEYLINKYNI